MRALANSLRHTRMTQRQAPPGRPSCLGIDSVLTLLVTLAKRSCRRRRGASFRRTRGGSHSVLRAALIAVVPGHRSTMTMSSLGSSPSDGIVRGSPIAPGVTPVDASSTSVWSTTCVRTGLSTTPNDTRASGALAVDAREAYVAFTAIPDDL